MRTKKPKPMSYKEQRRFFAYMRDSMANVVLDKATQYNLQITIPRLYILVTNEQYQIDATLQVDGGVSEGYADVMSNVQDSWNYWIQKGCRRWARFVDRQIAISAMENVVIRYWEEHP